MPGSSLRPRVLPIVSSSAQLNISNIILDSSRRYAKNLLDPVKDSSISFTWIIVAAMSIIKEFCNFFFFWNVSFVWQRYFYFYFQNIVKIFFKKVCWNTIFRELIMHKCVFSIMFLECFSITGRIFAMSMSF